MSEWISVKERLPKIGETVLVYGSHGGIYTAYLYAHSENLSVWYRPSSKSHTNPTHWMPLPAPPGKEAKDITQGRDIIHCDDCRYFNDTGYDNPDPEMPHLRMGYCRFWRHDIQACSFCSYGMRKE